MSDLNELQTNKLPMAPKAGAALIFGIIGCVAGLSYGIPGIILGAIGLSLHKRAEQAMYMRPGAYRGDKIIRLAKKWSTAALVQGIILTVFFMLYFAFFISSNLVISSLFTFYFSTFHGGDNSSWSPLVDCYIWFDDMRIFY